jgi:heparin/heparan-sulfate lyase
MERILSLWVLSVLPALGSADQPGSQALGAGLKWKEVAETRIPVPPREHPRLYLRSPQAAQLDARLHDPALQSALRKLRSQAANSIPMRIELDALQCLVSKEQGLGRATIESALALLKKTELPQRQDACRVTGRMMVTGAIIYDWLYALLTPEEKPAFIAELVRLAKTQECGYSPTRQGSVTGHASEAMIISALLPRPAGD